MRQNLGFILQSFNLIPVVNLYKNITLPIALDEKKADKNYVYEILGIKDKMNKFPNELNGGNSKGLQ